MKRVAVVLPSLFVDTCLSWTVDEKNFTQSVSFELDTSNVEMPCWYPISVSPWRFSRLARGTKIP